VRYLSGQYLIDPAGPSFHFVWPAILFFVLMAMVGTTYCYFVSETNNKRAPITRMSQKVQTIGWTLAVVGLILIGFRVGDAQLPLVGSRLVLYIVALGFVALLAYVLWWMRVVLPQKNAAYEERLLRLQYQPRARRRR
jgi:TRAP-type C4-dicarboxylate transport system permease large subunit